MICKTTSGKGFRALLDYCLKQEKDAEILELNGLTRSDPKGLAQEFRNVCEENLNISKPVWHTSLSFSKSDNISQEKMKEIANKLIEKLGFTRNNNQFMIVQHKDKEHMHCHIICNRVGFDGKAIGDFYYKSRTINATKQLESEYKLSRVQDLVRQKNRIYEQLNQMDPAKQEIRETINSLLKQPGIKTIPELAIELQKRGIDLNVVKHSKTGKEFGVTFKMNDKVYKGSELGKNFVLKSLLSQLDPALKIAVKIISKGLGLGI